MGSSVMRVQKSNLSKLHEMLHMEWKRKNTKISTKAKGERRKRLLRRHLLIELRQEGFQV